jgi:hypothetical protein
VAKGPHRVGLMHQEAARERQVERAAQRCCVEMVDVTKRQGNVLQAERSHDRPRPLEGGLAEVDANHPPGRAHHLRQHGKPPERAAAAVDGRPPLTDAHPAECTPSGLRGDLRQAQQPPQVLIAAIKDVTPGLLRGRFGHARPPNYDRCPVLSSTEEARWL